LKFILFQVYKNWPDLVNLLLIHSGHDIPPPIDSPSNRMTVVLETDYSVVSSGFSATFQAMDEPTPGSGIQMLANVV
jgi:CUB domain